MTKDVYELMRAIQEGNLVRSIKENQEETKEIRDLKKQLPATRINYHKDKMRKRRLIVFNASIMYQDLYEGEL